MSQTGARVGTAEEESRDTLGKILAALSDGQNFKMEAGAGAGKTHSLIDTLQHILRVRARYLPREGQRVACITYTNVARNEIIRRTDDSPHIFAETIHGFLWEALSPFRKSLLREVPKLPGWGSLLEDQDSLEDFSVSYDLGFRGIHENGIRLHHDDIPALAIKLFPNLKFRRLIADRFPIILVDEYQDTPSGLAEAMIGDASNSRSGSAYGFFGDHWQQIYDKTCGSIDHLPVKLIQKRANWRSSQAVVHLLNGMRPELPQAAVSNAHIGAVTVYHTNSWAGTRGTHSKKGQIPDDVLKATLRWTVEDAQRRQQRDGAERDSKVLMLTHSSIASELGFANINRSFRRNEDFVRKNDDVVAFLLDVIEPCCDYFDNKQYGPMFDLLKRSRPRMTRRSDKTAWTGLFGTINSARSTGTVGDVMDILLEQNCFALPQAVTNRHRKWELACKDLEDGEGIVEPRSLANYEKFRSVSYREVLALREYVEENTPFSTQHGVKGAEYPHVLAVFGGGWTQYNFPEMLANFTQRDSLSLGSRKRFEKSRNLFYVACSRAKEDLVLLFTTELSNDALETLKAWVGDANIRDIQYSPEGAPLSSRRGLSPDAAST
ncbi:AAA family ATPase [Streptomyces sp. NBC_00341]|uniref:UvrD-helicase domain-containing protein n=1 Tax=unclassified Streptomyces TaxID=2593676 RepID=UPI00308E04D3|nr:AAA family ATPase [Streptomyces sp. NBC_00341]